MQAQQELDYLRNQVQNAQFDDDETAQRLSKLKLLARDPKNAPCIYRSGGLRVLARIAFDLRDGTGAHEDSSLEAARIIANALLLQPATQQMFADLGYIASLVRFYSQSSANHEFVGGRILFLLTYQSNVEFDELVDNQGLVKHIDSHLVSHASSLTDSESSHSSMSTMALTETLKLVYNVATKCHTQDDAFTGLVPVLLRIGSRVPIGSNPLEAPISQLLNALGIIEWPPSLTNENEDPGELGTFAKRLTQILDKSVSSLPATQLENVLIAPLTILRKIVLLSHARVNSMLRDALLPRDEERDRPLGQSQTLASKLLQLQSVAGVIVLPEAISGLLFDLSDRDASKFVRNIGYGHAAGYLMTHQIPIPEDMTTKAHVEDADGIESEVNPITGQKLEAETQSSMPEMTEEEKEKEAERLFVLFERLRATGVVNVENPVKSAQQSGRFEELSDSEHGD